MIVCKKCVFYKFKMFRRQHKLIKFQVRLLTRTNRNNLIEIQFVDCRVGDGQFLRYVKAVYTVVVFGLTVFFDVVVVVVVEVVVVVGGLVADLVVIVVV